MSAAPITATGPADVHPLLAQLVTRHGAVEVTAAAGEAFCDGPGARLLVFTEDPSRYRETLDLAVIVPELARAFRDRFAVGVLYPDAARALQPRFGFRRWPALVLLRDGEYVGAIDGLRNWDEYLDEISRLLDATPTRPPTIGVRVVGGGTSDACGEEGR